MSLQGNCNIQTNVLYGYSRNQLRLCSHWGNNQLIKTFKMVEKIVVLLLIFALSTSPAQHDTVRESHKIPDFFFFPPQDWREIIELFNNILHFLQDSHRTGFSLRMLIKQDSNLDIIIIFSELVK